MKTLQRFLIALIAVGLVCGCASRRQPSASKPPTQAADLRKPAPAAAQTPTYMRTLDYASGGPVPPMEAGRKIDDKDCTQPVEAPPTSGNLRCQ